MKFPYSQHANNLLKGLKGVEIGGSAHNSFGLDTINVDVTKEMTVFKKAEMEICGEYMPVDVVSEGDVLPFEDNQFDFVISSHVIEHIYDPIKAIKEWRRVASKYVYIIAPKRNALPSDAVKPLTDLQELTGRHMGKITFSGSDPYCHHTIWTIETFLEMCDQHNFHVLDYLPTDDKVGNGFTVVIKAT
jgi:ubiquinone/menaquinone biosynthesis C-methylase UbiE